MPLARGHGPSWFLHPKDICIHLVRCTVGLAGAHSETRDYAELPLAYAQLAQAPAYNASLGQLPASTVDTSTASFLNQCVLRIRVTHLVAEFWDEVDIGLVALDTITQGP